MCKSHFSIEKNILGIQIRNMFGKFNDILKQELKINYKLQINIFHLKFSNKKETYSSFLPQNKNIKLEILLEMRIFFFFENKIWI